MKIILGDLPVRVLLSLLAIICYGILGGVWSFFRWTSFVSEELDFYESERLRFLRFHHIRGETIPDHLQFEWKRYVEATERLRLVPPVVQRYRGHVAFDIVLWPVSMVIVAINGVYSAVMNRIIAEYGRFTQARIERIKKDTKTK